MTTRIVAILLILFLFTGSIALATFSFDRLRQANRNTEIANEQTRTAETQTSLEREATQAEQNLAVRERIIIREVSNAHAELEAASSLGREALLAAWADASRRLRDEPALDGSADALDPAQRS